MSAKHWEIHLSKYRIDFLYGYKNIEMGSPVYLKTQYGRLT